MWPFDWKERKRKKEAKRYYIKTAIQKLEALGAKCAIIGTHGPYFVRQDTASEVGHVGSYAGNGKWYTTGAKGLIKGFPLWKYGKADLEKSLMNEKYFIIRWIPSLTSEQIADGLHSREETIGSPYPWWDIISMKVQNWLKPGQKELWFDDKLPVCSQSEAWFYEFPMKRKLAPHLNRNHSMYFPDTVIFADPELQTLAEWRD